MNGRIMYDKINCGLNKLDLILTEISKFNAIFSKMARQRRPWRGNESNCDGKKKASSWTVDDRRRSDCSWGLVNGRLILVNWNIEGKPRKSRELFPEMFFWGHPFLDRPICRRNGDMFHFRAGRWWLWIRQDRKPGRHERMCFKWAHVHLQITAESMQWELCEALPFARPRFLKIWCFQPTYSLLAGQGTIAGSCWNLRCLAMTTRNSLEKLACVMLRRLFGALLMRYLMGAPMVAQGSTWSSWFPPWPWIPWIPWIWEAQPNRYFWSSGRTLGSRKWQFIIWVVPTQQIQQPLRDYRAIQLIQLLILPCWSLSIQLIGVPCTSPN